MAIQCGMSTGDDNHQSASYLMHTGFRKGSGGVVHPSLGAIVSLDLGNPESDMPNFVAVGSAPSSGKSGRGIVP